MQGKKVCSIVDPQETNSNEVVDSGASSAKTNKSANITIFIGENDPPPINTQYHEDGNLSNSTTGHILPNLQDLRHRAIRITVPMVIDAILPHIMLIEDPKIMWIKLRDMFQSSSMNKCRTLKSQSFYSLRLIEETTIGEYLQNVSYISSQLANIIPIILNEELC